MLDADLKTTTRHLLEESTQHDENSLQDDLYLRDIEGWDSMGMVMFIGLVKEHLSVELSVHDLSQRSTVAELCLYVEALVGSRDADSRNGGSPS